VDHLRTGHLRRARAHAGLWTVGKRPASDDGRQTTPARVIDPDQHRPPYKHRRVPAGAPARCEGRSSPVWRRPRFQAAAASPTTTALVTSTSHATCSAVVVGPATVDAPLDNQRVLATFAEFEADLLIMRNPRGGGCRERPRAP
jgi:hypothetical protein